MTPHDVVLPELTDEALADEHGAYRGDVRLALLRLPAQWRQTALAEHFRRTTRVEPGGLIVTTSPMSFDYTVDEILAREVTP